MQTKKGKYAILLFSITVSNVIAVWLWLCYLYTPLAPFYICAGGCLDHNDEIHADMYQLKENLSIDWRIQQFENRFQSDYYL